MAGYFTDILGNAGTKSRLADAVSRGTLPHALIIAGDAGCGKHTLALGIAEALSCERRGSSVPCGLCDSCRRIREGNFPDVMTVRRPDGRATLGVDDIRAMKEDTFLSATEAEYKVYIIEDAETMTPAAQNALLKVLEEPPEKCIIILLCSDPSNLLVTVRSRAQTLTMEKFDDATVRDYLIRNVSGAAALAKSDPQRLDDIVISAGGRIGEAKRGLDPRSAEAKEAERQCVSSLVASVGGGARFPEIYAAVCSLPQKRQELSDALTLAMTAVRDIITVKTGTGLPLLFYTSEGAARDAAANISRERAGEIFGILTDTYDMCQKNTNVQATLASLASRIRFG